MGLYKTFIIGFLFSVCILVGIFVSKNEQKEQKEKDEMRWRCMYNVSGADVSKLNYNNHEYLQFYSGSNAWGVHDPDCKKCKNVIK